MRRSTFLVLSALAALLVLAFAAPAFADNGPHVMGAGLTPDSCAGCHRLHSAPAARLLKQDGTQLCYTCHGTSGTGATTDVEDGVQYNAASRPPGASPVGALRGGGFAYALIDTTRTGLATTDKQVNTLAVGQATTSTHSVNATDQVAWGNQTLNIDGTVATNPQYGTTVQLRCGSCHDPHGNGYYRILRVKPQQSGLPRTGTAANTGGVGILDVATKVYTTTNYWNVYEPNTTLPAPAFTGTTAPPNNMSYNGTAAVGTTPVVSGIAAWCSTCHTRYLAASGSAETSSGDAIFTYRHTSNREITTALNARNCVQCHVAHGSNASMGANSGNVNHPDNTTDPGGSKLLRIDNRGVCQVCHNK